MSESTKYMLKILPAVFIVFSVASAFVLGFLYYKSVFDSLADALAAH